MAGYVSPRKKNKRAYAHTDARVAATTGTVRGPVVRKLTPAELAAYERPRGRRAGGPR